MTERKLKDGTLAEEMEFVVTLVVQTKCPGKWKLIDMETGEEYLGVIPLERKKNRHWKKINGH
jgi:hypothetical protein